MRPISWAENLFVKIKTAKLPNPLQKEQGNLKTSDSLVDIDKEVEVPIESDTEEQMQISAEEPKENWKIYGSYLDRLVMIVVICTYTILFFRLFPRNPPIPDDIDYENS